MHFFKIYRYGVGIKIPIFVNNNGSVDVFTADQVPMDGYTANGKIIFTNKQIDKIQLIPVNLGMKDPDIQMKNTKRKKEGYRFIFASKIRNPKYRNSIACFEVHPENVSGGELSLHTLLMIL